MVTKKDVQYVAKLSRLDLGSDEDNYIEELNEVLHFMEKLNELDTKNVEPSIYVLDMHNVLREDIVENSITNEEALKNAPDKDDYTFRVPSIL